jgi:hypothetical protein
VSFRILCLQLLVLSFLPNVMSCIVADFDYNIFYILAKFLVFP